MAKEIKKLVIGYNRVSTQNQKLEKDRETLINHGCTKIFEEKRSGTKRDNRAELNKLLKYLTKYKNNEDVEIIVKVVKIDRLARSIVDLRGTVDEIVENNATITFIENGLTFSNNKKADAMSKAMLNLLGTFAELERDFIVERTRRGKEYARQNNPDYRDGRPLVLSDKDAINIVKLNETMSLQEIADMLKVSRRTIVTYKKKGKQLLEQKHDEKKEED